MYPWTGNNWGNIFIPRVGQEVVVTFIDNDPDRPLVVGCLYNQSNMVPYALPDNKTQSGIKFCSTPKGSPANSNELRFEDKKGEEHIFMHAQKDFQRVVENDETQTINHDQIGKAYKDIINFIVFSLSLNLSLNWSYDCLITLPDIEEEAIGLDTLIPSWIKEPTDEVREGIRQKSETINYANSWGVLGMSVYWIIRSLIANSIIFAALKGDANLIEQRFEAFIQKGISDMHVCPMVTGVVPHVGGPIMPPGAITVLICSLPAARVGDMEVCVGPTDFIVLGSMTVLIDKMPAARLGDMSAHGGSIVAGAPTVLVG
eukprot:gene13643-13758_t